MERKEIILHGQKLTVFSSQYRDFYEYDQFKCYSLDKNLIPFSVTFKYLFGFDGDKIVAGDNEHSCIEVDFLTEIDEGKLYTIKRPKRHWECDLYFRNKQNMMIEMGQMGGDFHDYKDKKNQS